MYLCVWCLLVVVCGYLYLLSLVLLGICLITCRLIVGICLFAWCLRGDDWFALLVLCLGNWLFFTLYSGIGTVACFVYCCSVSS